MGRPRTDKTVQMPTGDEPLGRPPNNEPTPPDGLRYITCVDDCLWNDIRYYPGQRAQIDASLPIPQHFE